MKKSLNLKNKKYIISSILFILISVVIFIFKNNSPQILPESFTAEVIKKGLKINYDCPKDLNTSSITNTQINYSMEYFKVSEVYNENGSTYVIRNSQNDFIGCLPNVLSFPPIPIHAEPTITINGENPISTCLLSKKEPACLSYIDQGATAHDYSGKSLPVKTVGYFDQNTPGVYYKTYIVTDSDGYSASKVRTVNVVKNAPPLPQ